MARLRKAEFQREIMSQNQPDDAEIDSDIWMDDLYKKFDLLVYLNTQASIRAIADFINTTRQYEYSSRGGTAYAGFWVITLLRGILLNKEFLELTQPLRYDIHGVGQPNTDLLIKAKQWMMDNEGKYQVRQDIEPSLRGLL